MDDAFRPKTRRLTLTDAFGPESRSFNIFKRVYTTALVTSFAFYIAAIGLPLSGLPMTPEWNMIITFSLGTCALVVNVLLIVSAAIAMLLSARARLMIRFWLGLCLSPIVILCLPVFII